MVVPDAKSHPVLRRYPLRRLRLPVAGRFLDLVVPDGRGWMRAGTWVSQSRTSTDEPPYWVEIWPASVAIARWLTRTVPRGTRVLDLGCGLGVPGTAAAAAGGQVVFADRIPDALAFACWNATRNHPEGVAPRTLQFDWNRDSLGELFDVVILADVSYRKEHHRPFLRLIEQCLVADGAVVHADPFRPESREFLDQLSKTHPVTEQTVESSLRDRRVTIRLAISSKSMSRWEVRSKEVPSATSASTTPERPGDRATGR